MGKMSTRILRIHWRCVKKWKLYSTVKLFLANEDRSWDCHLQKLMNTYRSTGQDFRAMAYGKAISAVRSRPSRITKIEVTRPIRKQTIIFSNFSWEFILSYHERSLGGVFDGSIDWLIVRLIDWLKDRLIDWLIVFHRLCFDWLIDCLIDRIID